MCLHHDLLRTTSIRSFCFSTPRFKGIKVKRFTLSRAGLRTRCCCARPQWSTATGGWTQRNKNYYWMLWPEQLGSNLLQLLKFPFAIIKSRNQILLSMHRALKRIVIIPIYWSQPTLCEKRPDVKILDWRCFKDENLFPTGSYREQPPKIPVFSGNIGNIAKPIEEKEQTLAAYLMQDHFFGSSMIFQLFFPPISH